MAPRSEVGSLSLPRRTSSMLYRGKTAIANIPTQVTRARNVYLQRASSWPRQTRPSHSSASRIVFPPKADSRVLHNLTFLGKDTPSEAEFGSVHAPRSILKKEGSSGVHKKSAKRSVRFPLSVLLWDAAERNDTFELTELLKRLPRRSSRNSNSGTENYSRECSPYIDEDVFPLDVCTHEGVSLLHICTINGNEHLVRELLSRGATPDIIDCDGWTPLHVAANVGRLDIVYDLVAAGAVIPSLEATEIMDGLAEVSASHTVTRNIEDLRKSQSVGTAV